MSKDTEVKSIQSQSAYYVYFILKKQMFLFLQKATLLSVSNPGSGSLRMLQLMITRILSITWGTLNYAPVMSGMTMCSVSCPVTTLSQVLTGVLLNSDGVSHFGNTRI